MKAIVLLAGVGRRINETEKYIHKSMISINGKPLLYYWMNNIMMSGIDTLVPVLGYNGKYVLEEIQKYSEGLKVCPVWNDKYEETNNMVSLLCAFERIDDSEDVIQFNGDMIFDWNIIKGIADISGSYIAVDTSKYDYNIDSPSVLINNNRITDIGRHIEYSDSCGYAIGVYRYSAELRRKYFELASKLSETNPNMGFHDPLRTLFEDNMVLPYVTNSSLWMDVDDKNDIVKAERMVEILGY